MTDQPQQPQPGEPEVLRTIFTEAGRKEEARAAAEQERAQRDARMSEKYREFARMAIDGKLPDPGKVEPLDPAVTDLLSDLAIVHLPDWHNSAGRKLADATMFALPSAVRLAAYLVERGWIRDPARERIRWTPTPGGLPGPYDVGLHIRPDPDTGEWPQPDAERFWDIDDVEVAQLPDGTWKAEHPRGIAYQASTKSEAFAGIVERIRDKIKEAENG